MSGGGAEAAAGIAAAKTRGGGAAGDVEETGTRTTSAMALPAGAATRIDPTETGGTSESHAGQRPDPVAKHGAANQGGAIPADRVRGDRAAKSDTKTTARSDARTTLAGSTAHAGPGGANGTVTLGATSRGLAPPPDFPCLGSRP
ncbi:MAG: hypothetical protein ACE5F1_08385 [Planctomycetota bacterium]